MTGGAALTEIVESGEGVSRRCNQSNYSTGFGVQLATPVLTQWTSLQVSGRGYWLNFGSTCETADLVPPPDGTYVVDDRVDLLARSFVTTDIRLAAQLGATPLSLAVGGGNAWRRGYNLPYLVFAATLTLWDRPAFHLDLGGELQWLRVSADRFRRTYLNSELIVEESLGRVHRGSHAVIIGLSLSSR